MPHPRASLERSRAPLFTAGAHCDSIIGVLVEDDDLAKTGADSIDWTEQDVVFLHEVAEGAGGRSWGRLARRGRSAASVAAPGQGGEGEAGVVQGCTRSR